MYTSGNSALYAHYYIDLHLVFCSINIVYLYIQKKSIDAKEIENISVYSY